MSGFDWLSRNNSAFANTRMMKIAGSQKVVDIPPHDIGASKSSLLPAPGKAEPTPQSINPLVFGSFSTQQLLIGLADQIVLYQPPTKRIYLLIQNTHATQNLYIAFGTASAVNSGIRIPPGGNYELNTTIPQDDIHLIADGINTTGVLIYSNKGVNEGA